MKLKSIKKTKTGKFLNMYNATYINSENNEKIYELVSREAELTKEKFQQCKQAEAVGMIIFSIARDKILVQKEFRLACNSWVINFPGGLINIGENCIDAAKRELREETGLEISSVIEVLQPACTAVGVSDEEAYTVIGTARRSEFKKSTSADEEIEPMWIDKEQAKKLINTGAKMSLRTQTFLWMWIYGEEVKSII